MPSDFQRPFPLPDGATEVLLVRHGSSVPGTPEQPVDLTDGRADPPIGEEGRRQALAVAHRLGDDHITEVFVTPLRRTLQTAAPLAERLGLVPVVVEDLREIHLGDWEGELSRRVVDRDPLSARVFAAQRWDVIPNAEDMEGFAERVRRGMDHVATVAGPDATAVAVLHGGVIAEICRQATQSSAFAFLYAENASISRVMRLSSGRWALRSFNDTAHLQRVAEAARA